MSTAGTRDASVRHLLETQSIVELKHRYAELCDTGFDPNLITGLFASDPAVVWRSNLFGTHRGHAAIRAFFTSVRTQITWATHIMANPTVRLHDDGSRATGTWTLLELASMPTDARPAGEAVLMAGRYRDRFTREDGRWRFTEIHIDFERRTTLPNAWEAPIAVLMAALPGDAIPAATVFSTG